MFSLLVRDGLDCVTKGLLGFELVINDYKMPSVSEKTISSFLNS